MRRKITIDSGAPFGCEDPGAFNAFERFVHWLTSRLVPCAGASTKGAQPRAWPLRAAPAVRPEKPSRRPRNGASTPTTTSPWPFMAGLVFMLVVWIKDNIPTETDVALAEGGRRACSLKGCPPAGEEVQRRGGGPERHLLVPVIIGGAALSVTGVFLLFPCSAGGYADWQADADQSPRHRRRRASVRDHGRPHLTSARWGQMQGAFGTPWARVRIDYNWAREHHSLCGRGRPAASRPQRAVLPAARRRGPSRPSDLGPGVKTRKGAGERPHAPIFSVFLEAHGAGISPAGRWAAKRTGRGEMPRSDTPLSLCPHRVLPALRPRH